jgi:hypothetical protein
MSLTGPSGTAETVDILIPASSIVELMEQLKCLLCKYQMKTPITFCEKGHNAENLLTSVQLAVNSSVE